MGRGWQDRRGEKKQAKQISPTSPPPSPPPSPPGSQKEDIDFGVNMKMTLPQSVISAKKLVTGQSRFPIISAISPLGRMTRAHGY